MKNTDSGKKRSPVMLFTGLLFFAFEKCRIEK